MGKHIKTQMDYDMIDDLARELFKVDPKNEKLQHYLSMENFEGSELRKTISKMS
jgi:hypothetical protein